MKLKVLPLLTGAIALSLSLASLPGGFAAAIPAFAQSTTPTTPRQNSQRQNFLNLTADQKAQMKQIRQTERTAIDNILTADQKAQLKAARGTRPANPTGEKRGGFAALNLTADQRTQIEAARRTARTQTDAILTPEQRQQMEQHMKQHQQRPQAN